ncbi:MAG: ferritin-like domain-containing protein [Actinocatenispora sp.]
MRIKYDDVDYDAFRHRPLSPAALRTLRYMSDVESHTICYLRDLLVTPSHKDPEVTAFLTHWAYEEFWHGEALDEVLRVHGVLADYAHIREVRLSQGLADRLAPINQALAANIIGEDFVAVHMTWGAINEWSAHSAYARMIQREDHPELGKLLKRIQKQETRHLAFYASQAKDRLERTAKARNLTRFALRAFWAPVGSSIQPKRETAFVLNYLMGGPEGAKHIDRIDRKLDELPGQGGLNLVRKAVAKYGVGPGLADRKQALLHRLSGLRAAAAPRARTVAGALTRPVDMPQSGTGSGESTATA